MNHVRAEAPAEGPTPRTRPSDATAGLDAVRRDTEGIKQQRPTDVDTSRRILPVSASRR